MKHSHCLFYLIIFISLQSCEFNQSVNKDLTTGAYSRGNGIGVGGVSMEINGNPENRNEFISGETVNFFFNGVEGLTSENGKTFPGISMWILKNEDDTLLAKHDLLADLVDGTDLYPLVLTSSFRTGLFEVGVDHKISILLWDKKGEGTFSYEMPFTVVENDLLNIENNGFEYSEIYLWNETMKIQQFGNEIDINNEYKLILNELDGFEILNEVIKPVLSVELFDNRDSLIISNPNVLKEFETTGVNPDDIKERMALTLSFTDGEVNNPCKLKVKLKDNNSSKELEISAQLNLN